MIDGLLLAGWATVRAGWAVTMVGTCAALAVYDLVPRPSLVVTARPPRLARVIPHPVSSRPDVGRDASVGVG